MGTKVISQGMTDHSPSTAMTEVQLKVAKEYRNDSDRAIAQFALDALVQLSVSPGDGIEIEGVPTTVISFSGGGLTVTNPSRSVFLVEEWLRKFPARSAKKVDR